MTFGIYTSALSGFISTQYYGEEFKPEKIKKYCWLKVHIYIPKGDVKKKNVTLHLDVKKVSMTKLSDDNYDAVILNGDILGDYQTNVHTNFTPPWRDCDRCTTYRQIMLSRLINSEDLETSKLQVMPGFQVRWWQTGEDILPNTRKYKDDVMTKHFIRFLSLQNIYPDFY